MIHRFGELEIDATDGVVQLAGTPVPLTRRQQEVMVLLAKAGGEPVSKQALLNKLWHPGASEGVIVTCTSAIRKSLTAAGARDDYLRPVTGIGWRLKAPPTSSTIEEVRRVGAA